jgi:NAD(P)H-nitrite reductase large subunit
MMFDNKASSIVEKTIKENGTEILFNDEVIKFNGSNRKVNQVLLKSHHTISCDLVIVIIGIRPNIDFLKDSMITHDGGVFVDQYLRTNIPNVYAAGDVAQVPDPLFQKPTLHPTWGYAKEQGEIAAYNMAGFEKEYEGAVPLFSFNIHDLGVVTAGITRPHGNFEILSRFSLQEGIYRKFVLNENKLIGALIIGKKINRKQLKPLLKKAILKMVDVSARKTELLKDDFDFNSILKN